MTEFGTQPRWKDEENEPSSRQIVEQLEAAQDESARLQGRLADEHAIFESALEEFQTGIVICDTDGRFVFHNSAAEELWGGFEAAESIEQWADYREFRATGTPVEPDDWGLAGAIDNEEVLEPRAVEIERFDGERAVILSSASPYYGADGELRGAVAVFADITEIKQVEQAQRQARETAERAARRMTDLQEITTALFDAMTPRDVIQTVLDSACQVMGALRGGGYLMTDETRLEAVAEHSYDDNLVGFRQIDLEDPAPPAEAIRLDTGIYVTDRDEYERRYPHLASRLDEESSSAIAVLPLTVDGDPVGAFGIGYSEPRTFDTHDRAFLQTLAGQTAQAVRRAELYQREQQARAEAEAAHSRSRFISEASAILSSTLDYDAILERLAHLAVPDFADWCAVDLAGPDHSLAEPVTIAHVDPAKVESAYDYRRNYSSTSRSGGAGQVMETGESILMPRVPEELLREGASDDAHRKSLMSLGLESLIVVPLAIHDRTLGAITFASSRDDRRFDEQDLETAEELARRAALAIDNAALHRQSERARARLAERAEQQKAVARLARQAIDLELEELFDTALALLVDLLEADTAKLLEMQDDSTLLLRAGLGWREEWEEANLGPVDDSTAIGHALLANEVLVVEDLRRADYGPTDLESAHDLQSAMTVQVPGRLRPFGAIGVHSREPRTFTEEDTEFIRGVSNVLSDAIERTHVQQQREETYRRLGEALRDRQELLSIVFHDLRSPACAVQMNLDLIRSLLEEQEPDEEAIRESIEAAEGSVDRMIEMMTDLLEVARHEEEERGTEQEAVDFGKLVRRVTSGFEAEIAEAGSSLTLDLQKGVRGETDRVRFEQIIGNLVSNAIKYGDGEPIEASLDADQNAVEFRIRDHGVGIPPEHQDQIFERFHRIESDEETDSFGLGLWIVQRSVDALGGTIDFQSVPGEGTEFFVRLPHNTDGG